MIRALICIILFCYCRHPRRTRGRTLWLGSGTAFPVTITLPSMSSVMTSNTCSTVFLGRQVYSRKRLHSSHVNVDSSSYRLSWIDFVGLVHNYLLGLLPRTWQRNIFVWVGYFCFNASKQFIAIWVLALN